MDACGRRILKLCHDFCAKHKLGFFTCIYNNYIISIVNYRSFILSIFFIIFSTHVIILIYGSYLSDICFDRLQVTRSAA